MTEHDYEAAKRELELEKLRLDVEAAKVKLEKERVERDEKIREEAAAEAEAAWADATDDIAHGVYYFSGPVTAGSVRKCREAIFGWVRTSPQPEGEWITLDINSGGGSCPAGFDLFGVIRGAAAHGFRVRTIVSGFAGSMAGLLVQAGDERLIRRHSYLHLHEAATLTWGKTSAIRDDVRYLEAIDRRAAEIYAERSRLTAEEILAMTERREVILTDAEALDFGFVDRII